MNEDIHKAMTDVLDDNPDALFACVITTEGTHSAGRVWFKPYQELRDKITSYVEDQ